MTLIVCHCHINKLLIILKRRLEYYYSDSEQKITRSRSHDHGMRSLSHASRRGQRRGFRQEPRGFALKLRDAQKLLAALTVILPTVQQFQSKLREIN